MGDQADRVEEGLEKGVLWFEPGHYMEVVEERATLVSAGLHC